MLDAISPKMPMISSTKDSGPWMLGATQRYLSLSLDRALIVRSYDDKSSNRSHHVVELTKLPNTKTQQVLTALKVVSYATVIMPIMAYVMQKWIMASGPVHHYYIDNPAKTTSLSSDLVNQSKKSRQLDANQLRLDAKAIYFLENPADCNDLSKAFTNAVEAGDINKVETLSGINSALVANKDSLGETPFLKAVKRDNLKMAQKLYELDARYILDQDSTGNRCIDYACKNKNYEMIKWLYEIDPHCGKLLSHSAENPFLEAYRIKDYRLAELLAQMCPYIEYRKNAQGEIPFLEACRMKEHELVQLLYKRYPLMTCHRNAQEEGPFLVACKGRDYELIRILHELDPSIPRELDQQKNYAGMTYACSQGDIELIEALCRLPNYRLRMQYTPTFEVFFWQMCKQRNYKVVKLLADIPGAIDVLSKKNEEGDTPGAYAYKIKDDQLLKLLGERGPSWVERLLLGNGGASLFDLACDERNIELMDILWSLPDASRYITQQRRRPEEKSPMIKAIEKGDLDFIERLCKMSSEFVKEGISATLPSVRGGTQQNLFPIDFAIYYQRLDIVKKILEIDIRQIRDYPHTLLYSSYEKSTESDFYRNIFYFLLEKVEKTSGTITCLPWDECEQLLEVASEREDRDVIKRMRKYLKRFEMPNLRGKPTGVNSGAGPSDAYAVPFDAYEKAMKLFTINGKRPTSKKSVNKAFRILIAKWHPDKNGDSPESKEKTTALTIAHREIQQTSEWKNLPE